MVGYLTKKAREFIEQWACCEVKKKDDDNGECRSLLVSHTHRLPLRDSVILSFRPVL